MFEDRFPAKAPAKFVHIAKQGRYNTGHTRHALCGRMVNLMQIGTAETATCQKCVAEALVLSLSTVEG